MLTVLHASDLQCGRPHRPGAARAFVALARALEPDVVVISGDLTQRAKAKEFAAARAIVADLGDVPCVVTPGNHDVPLWRIWERALAPHMQWRRHFGPALDTVTDVPGARFVALDSSAPRSAIVAGRLLARQVDFARDAFAAAPREALRALVVHHHFVPTPDREGGRPLPGAAALLRAFEQMGVDVVLGGHVHQTHLTTSRALVPGEGGAPGIPLLACGTTASARGRGPEAGLNSLNVIRVDGDGIEVEPHRLDAAAQRFEPRDRVRFERRRPVEAAGGGP